MQLLEHLLNLTSFASHPRRLLMNAASLGGGWYLAHVILQNSEPLVAVLFGAIAAVIAPMCVELALQYFSKGDGCLVADFSVRVAQYPQTNSTLLNFPIEMQFEIAHFLTPEDLLVARTTCHKVNDLLKSESARFWLQTRLLRTVRGQSTHDQDCKLRGNPARSFFYDVVALGLSKIVKTRDPAQILRSNHENDCVLKWVYLNADWIRKQNLPALGKEGDKKIYSPIKLTAGEIGFDVFRHMPGKSSLRIILTYNDHFAVERIEVPREIYDMIQQDPFSFMAAETLSAPEMSSWHLAMVTFAAMTIIFAIQHLNDVCAA